MRRYFTKTGVNMQTENIVKILGHNIDHIGIVARDIEKAIFDTAEIFNLVRFSETIIDELQDVKAVFGQAETGYIFEFLEPLSENSPVANSLNKSSNLFHHVAFRTPDISCSTEMIREKRGMQIGEPKPGIAFDNSLIQFFLLPDGWLIELIEQPVSRMQFPINRKDLM